MEDAVFKNSNLAFLLQDLPKLFFGTPRIAVSHASQVFMRRVVQEMEKTIR